MYLPIGITLVLLLAAVAALVSAKRVPSIRDVKPNTAPPGTTITVSGSGFSQEGRLEIDGRPIQPKDIRSWTDSLIVFSLPEDSRSGLLRVQTGDGASNSVFITNTRDIPRHIAGHGTTLDDLQPSQGAVGTVIRLVGSGFGPPAEGVAVVFSSEKETRRFSAGDMSVHGWTNEMVELVLPEDIPADEYAVSVGESGNRRLFTVDDPAGEVELGEPVGYTMRQELATEGIGSDARGVFPRPLSRPEQPDPQLLRETALSVPTDDPVIAAYRFAPLPDIAADGDRRGGEEVLLDRIVRVDFVQRRSLRWSLSDSIDRRLLEDPVFREHFDVYLQPQKSMRSSEGAIEEVLRRNIKLNRDVGATTRGIHLVVIDRLNHEGEGGSRDIGSILGGELAHPDAYADLAVALGRRAGIPSRLVYGLLLDDVGQSIPHRWVEFFIPAVGWVPADPALGDGVYADRTTALETFYGDNRRTGTFGALDDRRITLAVEDAELHQIYPGGALIEPENSYASHVLHVEFPSPDIPRGAGARWYAPVVSSQFN